ncbi:MAG: DUF2231 domain-containing protein [Bacteroidota bacterium]|nr:DUF2231 domain-containing protein [Bacteroidota bacterium]
MIKLHPAIVHFPVALLSIAALFAVISLFIKKDFFKEIAFWNLLLGVIGAVVAVLTGLIEEQNLIHNEEIHQILEKHKFTGFVILILAQTLLTWYWVRKNKFGKKEYILWVLFLVLGPAMLTYQGFLGGKMVFEQGAGVKPMELQMKKESHSHSNSAEQDHTNDHDTSSSKQTMPEKMHDHPGSEHDHKNGMDTSSSKKSIPEKNQDIQEVKKKKKLKDMKY